MEITKRLPKSASGEAVLAEAKDAGRAIISPAEEATDAEDDPEGFANGPIDGKDLPSAASKVKPTGSYFWLGAAVLGGAAWMMFGRKKKGRKRK